VDRSLDPNSPLPRYYQIYSALLTRIKTGELAAGDALPSERQIAEDYGVARLTVVKALDLLARDNLINKQHGRGTFVLPQPEENLKTIAFIKAGGLVQSELKGISETAFEQNYQLQVLAVDLGMNRVQSYLKTCIDNGVKGLIVYALPGYEDMRVYQNFMTEVPMVMIDRYYPELETDCVIYDDENAAFQLTEKLIKRGHQRIAVIPGFEAQATTVKNRLRGHYKALMKHKIPMQEELAWLELYNTPSIFGLNVPAPERERYRSRLLEKLDETKPTAVLTINDGIHDHLITDLNALESSVSPDETFALECATFSYRHLPETRHLKLLALQPGEILGQEAARLLIERLEGARRRLGPKQITVKMEILELGQKQVQRKEV
jgi:DNA-binding LacI/PurR family transcriptional regulator